MNRGDIENGIQRAWKTLEALGIAETFSTPGPLEPDATFVEMALSGDVKYSKLYMYGLHASQYNMMFSDYSFLQFGLNGEDEVRYAYYPNPFIAAASDLNDFRRLRKLVEADVITAEDYNSLISDKPAEGRVPLLRYENAPGQWKAFRHPCSHFHIGHHADNRWAANRVLTPNAFTLLVCKQYYSEEWFAFGDDDAADYGNHFEKKLVDERQNCRVIGDDLFTKDEARSFHLT